jgi:sensor histidine kinase YesM
VSLIQTHRTLYKAAIHVLIWLLLLLFPFLLSHSDNFDFHRLLKFTWIPMCWYAVIFYLNFFFLIDQFLFLKKIGGFVIINLAVIILFTWLNFEVREMLNMIIAIKQPINRPDLPPKSYFVYKDFIALIIPVIVSFAVKTAEKWTNTENERKEREKEILNSELQHLKYQLQPHFFFNSLNTVYALIERSPTMAQETVHNLSKLMRYLLYETDTGYVSLNQEINFMTQYINLMKLRISDKTIVKTSFPASADGYTIAPLLFISLIENAFKHGISATQPSEISFVLQLQQNNTITFVAQNVNFPKNMQDKSGSGIGLANLRKRLELSYPGKYEFNTRIEGLRFTATLEIHND